MAILASFSHLFPAFIFIASCLFEIGYIKQPPESMYAHKIPNFETGLQVGCKSSFGWMTPE
jgi:hypothetical protein